VGAAVPREVPRPPRRQLQASTSVRLRACNTRLTPQRELAADLDSIEAWTSSAEASLAQPSCPDAPLLGRDVRPAPRTQGRRPRPIARTDPPAGHSGWSVSAETAWSSGQLGTVSQGRLLTSKTELVSSPSTASTTAIVRGPVKGTSEDSSTWELREAYRSWQLTGDALVKRSAQVADELCGLIATRCSSSVTNTRVGPVPGLGDVVAT